MTVILIRTRIFPGKQEIAADAHIVGGEGTSTELLEITLTDANRTMVPMRPKSEDCALEWMSARFDGSQLAPGEYVIEARLPNGEAPALEGSAPVTWPERPWWLGCSEGFTDEVLPPWTPIETQATRDGIAFCPWGRSYEFGKLPFPTRVQAAGAELLASPFEMVAIVDGERQEWEGTSPEWSTRTSAWVELSIAASSKDLEILASIRGEFDGMTRVDWTLRPKRALSLDALSLEIPIRAEHARYLYYYPGRWGDAYNARALPAEPTLLPFLPFLWLGDEERGLSFFCETDYNWIGSSPTSVTEVLPAGDVVTLRLNLVGQPVRLAPDGRLPETQKQVTSGQGPIGHLSYSFGLQATPVKPLTKDAWDYRTSHAGDYGIESEPSGYAALAYPALGNINLRQGTLELWVKPGFGYDVDRDQELFTANLPDQGQVRWYWSAETGGLRAAVSHGQRQLAEIGAALSCKPETFHHVALSWGDRLSMYVDGLVVASTPHQGLLNIDLDAGMPPYLQAEDYPLISDPRFASLVFGGQPSRFVIDDIRFSDVARSPEEIALASTGTARAESDVYTTLLDRLDSTSDPGNVDRLDGNGVYTRPVTAAPRGRKGGIVVRNARYAPGKFGNGLQLYASGPILEHLAERGVRTLCFHEHWSDIQSYHWTTHTEELRSLAKACHELGMQLLPYFGFQMSRLAPEFEAFHEECLIHPLSGYDFNRPPQLHQRVFRVCYNSPWQDSMVARIARLVDEFDIDGTYHDGTASPSACANLEHGCGYVRADGSVAPTYPIFAARQTMRRIYAAIKQRKPDGQVNVHQSTCMTIPSLAWATSLWDGEQFASIERGPFALTVLPLDAFRTEFMGHQWGVPQEFLCYERPYTYSQGCAFTLLHDVPVRPLGPGLNLELAAQIWHAFDEFGRSDAEWLPYWRNSRYVTVGPQGALASLYCHDQNGVLAVISNLGPAGAQVRAEFDLRQLRLGTTVEAIDVITDEEVKLEDGRLSMELPSLGWRMLWLRGS